jgi:HK97 family phage prohead protease
MISDFLHHSYEFKLSNLEKKSNKCNFSGYASLFDVVDSCNDVITPEAFDSVKNKKYVLLWQHNASEPIGKIISIVKDEKGLYVTGELCLGIQKANDVYHMLKEEIIDSMSIGYTAEDYEHKQHHDGRVIRLIKSIKLWEISLVTFPANEGAKITNVKKNNKYREQEKFQCDQYNYNQCDDQYDENDESILNHLDEIIKTLKNKN